VITAVEKLLQVLVADADQMVAGSQAEVWKVSATDPASDGAYIDAEKSDQVCRRIETEV